MKYAYVTIIGKIIVEDSELAQIRDGDDLDQDSILDEDDAFKEIAKNKIYDMCRGKDFDAIEITIEDIKTAKPLLGSTR